jgi:hypothetical protein
MVLVSDGAWCSYAASRVVSHARACARVLPLPPLRLGTAEAQRPTRRPRRRGPCTGLHERASPCASRPVRSPTPRAARGRNADRVGRWLCPHGPPVRQGSGEPRPRWGWRLPDGAVRRRARPRTVRTPGVVGGGPARLEPPAAVARRNLGACGRPRAAGRNGLRNGARRAARGHAHPTGGGCTIAVHTPSRGAQPAPRGTHGVIPAPAPAQRSSSSGACSAPSDQQRRENVYRQPPADIWASHTFARRCHRRVRGACARWSRHSSRSGHPQGPTLRPRSMVDWRQNFQRAGFRIA